MRLTLMGCEYAGKRTLGVEISRWWSEQTGSEFHEPPQMSFHDHFTVPHVVHAGGHDDHKELSERQMLDLNPGLLEHYQRYQIGNKLHSGYVTGGPDLFLIDWFYADAVFAPLYYGYGGPGQYADRHVMARHMEAELLKTMPEMILVMMQASPEVIRQRKREGKSVFPGRHKATHFKEEDAELVTGLFQEEYDNSLINRKFTLDTTSTTVDETLQEFISRITKYITPEDRLRVLTHMSPEIPWL